MTMPASSPDDEIVSAVLDGVATPAENARVSGDATLRQRLAEMGRVRDAVAAPVEPLDEVSVRRMIAAAVDAAGIDLDVGDETIAAAATARAVAVTTSAGPAPARRRNQWGLKAVSIAAAVAVALLAVPVLSSLSSQGDDDMALSGADSGEAAEEATALSAASGEADDESTAGSDLDSSGGAEDGDAFARTVATDLGSFADVDVLIDATLAAEPPMLDGESLPHPESGLAEAQRYAAACAATSAFANLSPAPASFVATLDQRSVLVQRWTGPDDRTTVQVVDVTTCEVVAEATR